MLGKLSALMQLENIMAAFIMMRCCATETSSMDGRSCVLTLARCLDNAVCYASLRRLKMDCVWNETEDWKTGNGIVTGKTTRQERQMETDPKKNWKMHLVNHIKVVLTASGTRDRVLLEKSTE